MRGSRFGFSLIEIFITMGVAALLVGFAYLTLFGTSHAAELNSTVQEITALARQAQSRSISQAAGQTWGVHIANTTSTPPFYALFSGSSYGSGVVLGTYQLPTGISFVSSTLPIGTATDIIFSAIAGNIPASETIGIYAISQPSLVDYITIAQTGAIAFSVPENSSSSAPTPLLSSLGVATGPIGTEVTVLGANFATTGNTVSLGAFSLGQVSSPDGTSLVFRVPSVIPLGTYQVAVSNTNGISNSLSFTVTISAQVATPAFNDIFISGNYLYGVDFATVGKMYVVDISNPGAPRLLTSIVVGNHPRYIRVVGQYAYIADNYESALAVVNISYPSNPVLVTKFAVPGNAVRDLDVQGQYAYIAGYTNGSMTTVNVANPSAPAVGGVVTYASQVTGIAAQGGYVYTGGDADGRFQVINIANPTNPFLQGSVTLPGGITTIAFSGHYAFTSSVVTGNVSVIDISSSTAPVVAATITGTGASYIDHIFTANGRLYAAGDTLTVWNISNPASPSLIATIPNAAGDTPLFVAGSYLYFNDNSGLVVYDTTRW